MAKTDYTEVEEDLYDNFESGRRLTLLDSRELSSLPAHILKHRLAMLLSISWYQSTLIQTSQMSQVLQILVDRLIHAMGLYELETRLERRLMSRDGRNRKQRQRDRSPPRSYWCSSSSERNPDRPEELHSQKLSEDVARAMQLPTTIPDLFGCRQCFKPMPRGGDKIQRFRCFNGSSRASWCRIRRWSCSKGRTKSEYTAAGRGPNLLSWKCLQNVVNSTQTCSMTELSLDVERKCSAPPS
jgi:hypothetical protein